MSSSQEKKNSAGKKFLPVGENKPGLSPAIPFCEPKVDEDNNDVKMIKIQVMILSDITNIDIKTIPGIKNLTGAADPY